MATGPRGRPIRIERRLEEASDTDDELFFDIAKRNTKSSAGADQGASVEKVTADQDTLHSNDISQGHETQPQHGQEDTGPTSPGHYGGEGPHPAAWTPLSSPHRQSCSSLVDGLLFDIYDRWHYRQRDSFDSDTFTECSSTSDAFFGRSDSLHLPEFEQRHSNRFRRAFLEAKDVLELQTMVFQLRHRTNQASAILIRQLKRRDRRRAKMRKNYDLLTAILQAASLKRRIDTRIRFSVEPLAGGDAFQQWRDAMRAVARLPLGIPREFRKKVWLALADQYINNIKIDWEKTRRFVFNEKRVPDDDKLGMQIVKDLHRTGCSGFNGQDNEEDRVVLKRVLLAYARWNKMVGYCQGFNVLAALILDVVDRKEDDALKVMILLIDYVLPDSYFANNLRALSVDMAVFRDLLRLHLPLLSRHLDHLQLAATDDSTGANYEPPLTNVFTMQWFLTLFATCLPKSTALRVWDSVLLEGSEILLRTALAIWGRLQERILAVPSADEFYTTMGVLTQEMLDENMKIMEPDSVIKAIYSMAPFPLPHLAELREKYTYNITPFTAAMSTGRRPTPRGKTSMSIFSDDEDWDEDDIVDQINCFAGIFPAQGSPLQIKPDELDKSQSGSSYDISKVSPGAYGATPQEESFGVTAYQERMTMDIHMLKNQYKRLRQRQNQAHIILAAASAARQKQPTARLSVAAIAPIELPIAVNHLFIGRNGHANNKRNRHVTEAPTIAPLFHGNGRASVQTTPKKKQVNGETCTKTRMESTTSSAQRPSLTLNNDSRPEFSCTVKEKCEVSLDEEVAECSDCSTERRLSAHSTTSMASETSCGSRDKTKTGDSDQEGMDSLGGTVSPHHNTTPEEGRTEHQGSPVNLSEGRPSPDGQSHDNLGFQCDKHRSREVSSPTGKPTLLVTQESEGQNGGKEVVGFTSVAIPVTGISNGVGLTKDLEHSNHYVAHLMYKGQKKTLTQPACQETNNNTKDVKSTTRGRAASLSHIETHQDDSAGHKMDVPAQKAYNPFPMRINPSRAQNGVRLGLYSPDNLPVVDMGARKPSRDGVKQIGRAQINVCLHRQYMAEVRQQARTHKNQ